MDPLHPLKNGKLVHIADHRSQLAHKTMFLVYFQDQLVAIKRSWSTLILPQCFNDKSTPLKTQASNELHKLLGVRINFAGVDGVVQMRGNKVRIATCHINTPPKNLACIMVPKELLFFPNETSFSGMRFAPLLRKTFGSIGQHLAAGVGFI